MSIPVSILLFLAYTGPPVLPSSKEEHMVHSHEQKGFLTWPSFVTGSVRSLRSVRSLHRQGAFPAVEAESGECFTHAGRHGILVGT